MQQATTSFENADKVPNVEVLVIGAGPVGVRLAQDLAQKGKQVAVLTTESVDPYNRVRLTPLLGGDVQFADITLLPGGGDAPAFDLHLGQRVTELRTEDKQVVTADGKVWSYGQLDLATGSSAFVPKIPGRDRAGVYTFRTAADVSALIARSICFSTRPAFRS